MKGGHSLQNSQNHYSKGIRKRKEILETALQLIGSQGFEETTLHDIAQAVHLSESGVLHYFESMDNLYIQILAMRDAEQASQSSMFGDNPRMDDNHIYFPQRIQEEIAPQLIIEQFIEIMSHNQETPGLVELYAHMQIAATDPNHPARAYFQYRQRITHQIYIPYIEKANELGYFNPAWDPATAVRTLTAVADGLQLQWLSDHSIDIGFALRQFFAQLGTKTPE